jgi:CHAT domain-containing protein
MGSSTGLSRIAVALLCVWCGSAAPDRAADTCHVAQVAVDRGEYASAVSVIDAQIARGGASEDDAARLRVLAALAFLGMGDWSQVVRTAAPELPQNMRSSETEVQRLRALAIASYSLMRHGDAILFLDRAERLAERAQPQLVSSVWLDRALMRRLFPADVRERAVRAALTAATRRRDSALQMRALGALALLFASQERFDEATEYGEQTLRLATKLHDNAAAERSEMNLGWFCNELGDRELAVEHLTRAAELSARRGLREDRVAALLQLAESEVALGNDAAVERDLALARDVARSISSPRLGHALAALAQLAFRRGDLGSARRWNAAAITFNQRANETAAILHSAVLDARIRIAERDAAGAQRELERVISQPTAKAVRWEAQTVLAQLYASQRQPVLAECSFRDAIATAEEARRDIDKSELRLSFPQLSKELYDSYIDFAIADGRPRDALAIAERNRARTLAEGLQRRGITSLERAPEDIPREARSVVLAYWLGAHRSWVWAVTPADVRVAELPPSSQIETALDAYQSQLVSTRGALEESRAPGEALYAMLVAPVADPLRGESRVAIVADGRLATFNFETLVEPRRHRYWIEDVTIEYAPALEFIARDRAPESGGGSMLLVANAAPADTSFPPLIYAGAEVDAVRRHFGSATALIGDRATPDAWESARPESYAFLHFIAHGVATRQRPLDSSIVLAGDAGTCKLYARTIVRRPLRARLVTISACHGAGRRAFKGEGLVGLAWAFLDAGAHEVIAALWEVNDAATPELMDVMYRGVTGGRRAADALRDAKLQLIHSDGVFRKPLYWAPFVIYSGS